MSGAPQVAAPPQEATASNSILTLIDTVRAYFEERGGPGKPSPLSHLKSSFALSDFEADILLLAAAAELHPEVNGMCAALQGDQRLAYPTFRLAMSVLPGAHWSATLPHAALRRWMLIDVGPCDALLSAPLHIDEPILHFLMGLADTDDRLENVLDTAEPVLALPGSYRAHAQRLLQLWRRDETPPIALLHGNARRDKHGVAAAVCAAAGLTLRVLPGARIPGGAADRAALMRLLVRDAVLNGSVLLVDCASDDPAQEEGVRFVAERFPGAIMIAGDTNLPGAARASVPFTINRPAPSEQSMLWRFALGEKSALLNGHLDRISAQFSLEAERLLSIGAQIAAEEHESTAELEARIWTACRAEARSSLEGLAQRVETNARWEDLVLPDSSLDVLRAMVAQAQNHGRVLDDWGFAAKTPRGLSSTALFCGGSGTGKTLAAEVLANELELDLFRVDLSQVVSKYIGETEKNLRTIFDAAENTSTVLLFDEADALFGKRSEVRDSHDRYANIEVSYLLQRMEAYRGIALLTTNMRNALDPAFLRRIRFVVQFPFPEAAQRKRIWERIFPPALPVEGVDLNKLAKLNLPGGNIRNIALSAAYIAAEENGPLRMRHLLTAARRECAKLERPLTDTEIGGWA